MARLSARLGLVWFGLFNGISTFVGYLNAKAILIEEQQWYYLTHSWEDKGIHTFPKVICPKVNIIGWPEFELTYYDSAVQHVNHYTTKTLPQPALVKMMMMMIVVLQTVILSKSSIISRYPISLYLSQY